MGSARVNARFFPVTTRGWTDWFRQMRARCPRRAGGAHLVGRGETGRPTKGTDRPPPERPRAQTHDVGRRP